MVYYETESLGEATGGRDGTAQMERIYDIYENLLVGRARESLLSQRSVLRPDVDGKISDNFSKGWEFPRRGDSDQLAYAKEHRNWEVYFELQASVLGQIKAFLKGKNAQAQASLQEVGVELLTLLDLELPNTLNVSYLSTNCIENVFKNLRRHIGRVSRWREDTDQADRWLASGLILASKSFRRIGGHADLPHLIKALERKMPESKKEAA